MTVFTSVNSSPTKKDTHLAALAEKHAESHYAPPSYAGLKLEDDGYTEIKNLAFYNDCASMEILFHLAHEKVIDNVSGERATDAMNYLFSLYMGKAKAPEGGLNEEQKNKLKRPAEDTSEINMTTVLTRYSRRFISQAQRLNDKIASSQRHNKGDNSEQLIDINEKVIIMAGFNEDAGANTYEVRDYENYLSDKVSPESAFNLIQTDPNCKSRHNGETIFGLNRYIDTLEVDAFAKQYANGKPNFYVHPCRALTGQATQEITDTLFENSLHIITSDEHKHKNHLLPLLVDDHFILLGLYTHPEERVCRCYIFDSMNKYISIQKKDGVQNKISRLMTDYGITGEPVLLTKNIQDSGYTPNACGVFVAKAMQALLQDTGKPNEILVKFIREFEDSHDTDKRLFNIRGRAELVLASLDFHTNQPSKQQRLIESEVFSRARESYNKSRANKKWDPVNTSQVLSPVTVSDVTEIEGDKNQLLLSEEDELRLDASADSVQDRTSINNSDLVAAVNNPTAGGTFETVSGGLDAVSPDNIKRIDKLSEKQRHIMENNKIDPGNTEKMRNAFEEFLEQKANSSNNKSQTINRFIAPGNESIGLNAIIGDRLSKKDVNNISSEQMQENRNLSTASVNVQPQHEPNEINGKPDSLQRVRLSALATGNGSQADSVESQLSESEQVDHDTIPNNKRGNLVSQNTIAMQTETTSDENNFYYGSSEITDNAENHVSINKESYNVNSENVKLQTSE